MCEESKKLLENSGFVSISDVIPVPGLEDGAQVDLEMWQRRTLKDTKLSPFAGISRTKNTSSPKLFAILKNHRSFKILCSRILCRTRLVKNTNEEKWPPESGNAGRDVNGSKIVRAMVSDKICFISTLARNASAKLLRHQSHVKLDAFSRCFASRKRFYRNTGILFNDGLYEITLDQKKLRTPKGNVFCVKSEPLALAVAAEWDSQKNFITPATMHLTGLCNTAIDNVNKLKKEDMIQEIIKYLQMDTVLFYSHEEGELFDLQKKQWTPIIKWFCQRFEVDVKAVRNIQGPVIKDETEEVIVRYLMSYNDWAIHGFRFVIEALKSVILGICCCEREITVENAVLLSRLEEEYQGKRWGRIEWAHEMNQQDLQARVAAGILFIHANSSTVEIKAKSKQA